MKGKCSVPMWIAGCPAGSCDEPAYGEQTKEYLSEYNFPKWNLKYRSPAYAPRLACPMHGGPTLEDVAHQSNPCEVSKGADDGEIPGFEGTLQELNKLGVTHTYMDYNDAMLSGQRAFILGKRRDENPCIYRANASAKLFWDRGWVKQSKIKCRGIELIAGKFWSGCTQSNGDCPECGK